MGCPRLPAIDLASGHKHRGQSLFPPKALARSFMPACLLHKHARAWVPTDRTGFAMTRYDYSGRTALITGGAGGIGSATALAFARAGANVVVADIADSGAAVPDLINAAGGHAVFIRCDVTRTHEVESLVTQTVAAYGALDFAFNNAGIEEEHARLGDSDETLFDRMMAINVKGVWACMRAELKAMQAQKHGVIINTASVAGLVGAPKHAIYGASKHAVIGLTKSAAAEYGRIGIRINAVCPGVIRTAMYERVIQSGLADEQGIRRLHPIGRIGEVDEVAGAVLWMCSKEAGFMTGHAMTLDGGMTAV
jgi:NAD(P)-dependent dehydrogenase (short-subunit alcohol dehydrogenase family)